MRYERTSYLQLKINQQGQNCHYRSAEICDEVFHGQFGTLIAWIDQVMAGTTRVRTCPVKKNKGGFGFHWQAKISSCRGWIKLHHLCILTRLRTRFTGLAYGFLLNQIKHIFNDFARDAEHLAELLRKDRVRIAVFSHSRWWECRRVLRILSLSLIGLVLLCFFEAIKENHVWDSPYSWFAKSLLAVSNHISLNNPFLCNSPTLSWSTVGTLLFQAQNLSIWCCILILSGKAVPTVVDVATLSLEWYARQAGGDA